MALRATHAQDASQRFTNSPLPTTNCGEDPSATATRRKTHTYRAVGPNATLTLLPIVISAVAAAEERSCQAAQRKVWWWPYSAVLLTRGLGGAAAAARRRLC